jgi:branched-chain amino acid transport system ATP-binding protein
VLSREIELMLLQAKDLRVYYDQAEAIKGISLEVMEGEIVTLVGANGAGKSTILKAVSGLKRPTSGEIWYRGERIDKLAPDEIVARGIAQVPEGRRVFPYMTVYENLIMGAYLRKNRVEIDNDLEKMYEHFPRLKERQRQPAGTLSGGEQQMLAIARALMSKPKLMLLDEPSLGLAPLMVREIGGIISRINQDGVSIVLVEQNVRLAFGLAHKAYVLETGKIVTHGDARELAQNDNVKKAYLGG